MGVQVPRMTIFKAFFFRDGDSASTNDPPRIPAPRARTLNDDPPASLTQTKAIFKKPVWTLTKPYRAITRQAIPRQSIMRTSLLTVYLSFT